MDSKAIAQYLLFSAETKEKMSEDPSLGKSFCDVAERLEKTFRKGGKIYSLGDKRASFKAVHYYEEHEVRYKAGKALGRADRGNVPAQCLSDIFEIPPVDVIKTWVEAKDTLVIFASELSSPQLLSAAKKAKENGAFVVSIASAEDGTLLAASNIRFKIPTTSSSIIRGVQSTVLHALCEILEPELMSTNPPSKEIIEKQSRELQNSLRESASVERSIANDSKLVSCIYSMRGGVLARLESGGWLCFAGNGGSAADALELYQDFLYSRLSDGRVPRVKHFLDPTMLTCAYNDDYSPFLRCVEGLNGDNNVLLVYSTSGKSENINLAVELAKKKGILTIALCGKDGGKLKDLAHHCLIIPSGNTGRIQEAHATVGQLLLP